MYKQLSNEWTIEIMQVRIYVETSNSRKVASAFQNVIDGGDMKNALKFAGMTFISGTVTVGSSNDDKFLIECQF